MGEAADDAARKADVEREEDGAVATLPSAQDEAREEAKATATNGDERDSEVRPEEFTRGTEKPTWRSPLPSAVEDELTKPLNPDRVRRRQGRGGGKFEYLAGHDVKRRANELFGFGNWSTEVVQLRCETEVEIVQRANSEQGDYSTAEDAPITKRGWHVAYIAVVNVKIRTEAGDWVQYQDVGYGDGNEWGPAALATSRELAAKESVTDALKRAFTCLGDQFGLILYAKADEKQRIERDARSDQASHPAVRVDAKGPPKPANWTELLARFDKLFNQTVKRPDERGDADEWLSELVSTRFNVDSLQSLKPDERRSIFVGFASALMDLEEQGGELSLKANQRDLIRRAIAEKNEAVALDGPPWNIGGEDDRPSKADWLKEPAPEEEEIEPILDTEGKEIKL